METDSRKRNTILVVDDELEMRELIAEYLRESGGYTVFTAENGRDALDTVLPKQKIDLVLSDINMPVMKGFELLHEVQRLYPHIIRVLITAYNVEEYLTLAMEHDIGNIIVKTVPFNFSELMSVVHNLASNEIFGVERYFDQPQPIKKFSIRTAENLYGQAQEIVKLLPPIEKVKRLELVLVEIMTNAIFYGALNQSAEKKETWDLATILPENKFVEVTIVRDDEKYGISIVDSGGRLNKKEMLYWLHRQIAQDADGAPIGVGDSHGRGLFITRTFIDRVIVNIEHGKKTEVIIINYFNKSYKGHKPIYINEL